MSDKKIELVDAVIPDKAKVGALCMHHTGRSL